MLEAYDRKPFTRRRFASSEPAKCSRQGVGTVVHGRNARIMPSHARTSVSQVDFFRDWEAETAAAHRPADAVHFAAAPFLRTAKADGSREPFL